MKNIVFTLVFFLLLATVSNVFCEDQNRSININSINIVTDRSLVSNGYGGFSMTGTDENGGDFYRQATRGVFNAPFTDCTTPCRKATTFAGTFYTDSWLTGGNPQSLNEMASLNGLTITADDWMIPVQFPYGRPITKYIPITVTGAIRVTDSRPMPTRIIYTDSSVNMSGIMKVVFVKSFFQNSVQWQSVEIDAVQN
ncbi:MAG TPA: hypothetical protein PKY59_22125 [Pyrinomonadaceae bacterium]|nr:hypothetical protein [Pyrinomonadaceae bacterium]